jgi:hypothetical protein
MTLRFLCKLQEPELLEPLLPPTRACLVFLSIYTNVLTVLGTPSFIRSKECSFCNLFNLPSLGTSHSRRTGPYSHFPASRNLPQTRH